MKKKLLFSRIAALICCIAMCAAFIIPLATTAADGEATVKIDTNAVIYNKDTNQDIVDREFSVKTGEPLKFCVEADNEPSIKVSPKARNCSVTANETSVGEWEITIIPRTAEAHTVSITVATPVTVTAPTGDGFTYTALSKPVYGDSFGFYITPKDGYSKPTGVYAKVSETKTAITEVSTNYYVIPELTESVEIVVEGVTSNSYTVSALSGNYTVNGLAASYNHGTKAEFTINANAGYEVTSVIVNMSGETAILTAGENGSYTIPKVTGNAVVTVNTQKVNSTITYAGIRYNIFRKFKKVGAKV